MKYKIPFQIFKQFAVSHKSSTINHLFLKHDKSHFKYPIPLCFSLAYTPQTLVNYRAFMSNLQYSSPDSYGSDLSSTWSSVSRLSKSSKRQVSPLCDPRRLPLFGRSSDSPPCDPGAPCGRSSDRLLLPPRVLFAARPILLLGRLPADSFRVSCSPIRLLRWDVWSGYCFSVGGSSVFR